MFVLNILFVLFCATSIRGETEVCTITDSPCVTERINEHMDEIAAGSEGKWDSLDPMTEESMEGATDKLTYKVTNITGTGFKSCKKCDVVFEECGNFSYYINCPELNAEGDYSLEGTIGDWAVQGEGHCTSTLTDYNIYCSGTYTTYTDDNEETHLELTYDTPTFKVNGKVQYTWTDLACGDAEKTQEIQDALNADWETLNAEITEGDMKNLIKDKYETTVKEYLESNSIEYMLSYETS